jgi:macrolide phosphotransferase
VQTQLPITAGPQSEGRTWEDLAQVARRAAPTLGLNPTRLVENGWDNRVLFADDAGGQRWVFRFPRRDDVLPDTARERKILGLIRDRLPVAVPDWRIDTVVDGQVVIGYPALPGEPAGYEPLGDGDFSFTIAVPPSDAYPASLGAALAALHTVDPAEVAGVLGEQVPTPDRARKRWREHLQRAGDLAAVPDKLAAYWAGRLDDDRLWHYRPVLRHGDVHPEHTLVDAAGTLTGIIDWTDAGLGDPATDFLDPRHAFGPDLGDRLLADYLSSGGIADDALGERVVLLQSLGPVPSLLYGLDTGRPAIADRARQRIATMAARLADTGTPLV